jgi:16S rRNA processing protein RimM
MDLVEIGKLGKTHGIKGELKTRFLEHYLDYIYELCKPGQLVFLEMDGFKIPYKIARLRNQDLLLSFEKVTSVEVARKLVNAQVYIARGIISDLDLDQISSDDLTAFNILDDDTGQVIGRIDRVEETPAHPIAMVIMEDGKSLFIPLADELISDIDMEENRIYMTLPEGLIDLAE